MRSPSPNPVTPGQVQAALAALGLTCVERVHSSPPQAGTPLTKVQGEIVSALTKKPVLNPRQLKTLEIYWKAATSGEPALAVDAVGTRLAADGEVDLNQATDFARGSLRSFGRRLRATLTKVPVQFGKDSMGDGFADEIPLLAMFDISKGSTGEVRHRLTSDGIVAVKAALGLSSRGKAAVSTVDEDYDPAEVVALGMSQGAASQIMRVAESKGMGIDEAIKLMTAMMGVG